MSTDKDETDDYHYVTG